ncbi:MAG TPA: carboxypeptidase-like regulatory domain-containing protein, partial [Mucilaginibacter sp.]
MQFKHLLKVCFFAVVVFFSVPVMAQNKTITGKVTDKKDGSSLIGVSVVAATGTAGGTVTDADGNYRITVAGNVTALKFTYVGYITQTVNIDGRSTINVSLDGSSKALNEVVVIGYGTQRVRDATG